MSNPALDLRGQRFGFLTVLRRQGSSTGLTRKARWLCRCDCGTEVTRESQYLRAKHRPAPRHCGCQHGNKRHAMSDTRPYRIWHGMRGRCLNPLDKDWRNYGARGITVCEAWVQSFAAFWSDMSSTYQPWLTLGRVDNSAGYSKANCRWETPQEQGNNTRANVMLNTPLGRMTLQQAATAYGLKAVTLGARLQRYGWSLERALTTPVPQRCTT